MPAALQQTLIGRVPHQGVFEAVNGIRRFATAEHEPGLLELGEPTLQCGLVASDHRAQQGMGELAPDGGTDLRDLPHRGWAVEPRHLNAQIKMADLPQFEC